MFHVSLTHAVPPVSTTPGYVVTIQKAQLGTTEPTERVVFFPYSLEDGQLWDDDPLTAFDKAQKAAEVAKLSIYFTGLGVTDNLGQCMKLQMEAKRMTGVLKTRMAAQYEQPEEEPIEVSDVPLDVNFTDPVGAEDFAPAVDAKQVELARERGLEIAEANNRLWTMQAAVFPNVTSVTVTQGRHDSPEDVEGFRAQYPNCDVFLNPKLMAGNIEEVRAHVAKVAPGVALSIQFITLGQLTEEET